MTIALHRIINTYVEASNKHDVKSILSCFSDDAVVHDEEETLHGKPAIEDWIANTIRKYQFQLKLINAKEGEAEASFP